MTLPTAVVARANKDPLPVIQFPVLGARALGLAQSLRAIASLALAVSTTRKRRGPEPQQKAGSDFHRRKRVHRYLLQRSSGYGRV